MELNNNLFGLSGGIKVGKDTVGEIINYLGSVTNPSFEDFKINPILKPKYEIKKFADKLKDCVALIIGCSRADLENQDFKSKSLNPQWWYYKFNKRIITYREYKKLSPNQQEYFELIKLTPRMILQLLGTEGGRKLIHPDIWINALFSDYKKSIVSNRKFHRLEILDFENDLKFTESFPNWIITDLRFPDNEGQAIKDRHGLTIGIKRHFGLRFPDYAHLAYEDDPYMIPDELEDVNPELYENLTHSSETSMGDFNSCDFVIDNNGSMEELYNKVKSIVIK